VKSTDPPALARRY